MNVAVFANPYEGTAPYLSVLSGTDNIEEVAQAQLGDNGIAYAIIDSSDLPTCNQLLPAATVDLSGPTPTFDFYFPQAQQITTDYNKYYWERQSQEALAELNMSPYQLALALSIPEADRTMEQQAAVDALSYIDQEQVFVQNQINSATTGQDLLTILGSLG